MKIIKNIGFSLNAQLLINHNLYLIMIYIKNSIK